MSPPVGRFVPARHPALPWLGTLRPSYAGGPVLAGLPALAPVAPPAAPAVARGPVPEQGPVHDPPPNRLAGYTPAQLAELARRVSAARMKASLALFVIRGWAVTEPDVPLEWAWYHDALCEHIQAMLEDWLEKRKRPHDFVQRIRNLCVNMPPGTLKSRILMVYAIAWMWLRCPTWKVLCISSNPENVTRDAENCRDLVASPWYRQAFAVTWSVREDIDSKKKYKLTAGGERVARGLIAKFTGVKAHAIFLDDPDDAHDVFSEASRKERASKWENAIFNRVTDRRVDIRIGLQQRVHEDDWSAQVLRQGTWAHLDVPQEADCRPCDCPSCSRSREAAGDDRVHTPIGWSDPRTAPAWAEGTLLHPERFTVEDLAEEKVRLGTYGYECQHNQRPASLAGGMFSRLHLGWFRVEGEFPGTAPRPVGCDAARVARVLVHKDGTYWAKDAKGEEQRADFVCLTVDASHGSLSDTASRTALLVVAGFGADRYVLHDSTEVRSYPQTKKAILELVEAFSPSHVLIESKANGRPVLDELGSEVEGLIGFDPKDGSKESRASAMMPAVEAVQFFLLEGASWVEEFVAEFCLFPHAKHDDRVDAASQLMTYFRTRIAPVAKWSKFGEALRAGNSGADPGV